MEHTDQSIDVYERAIAMCEGKSDNHQKLKDNLKTTLIEKLKREKKGYSIIEGIIRQNMDIKLKGDKDEMGRNELGNNSHHAGNHNVLDLHDD